MIKKIKEKFKKIMDLIEKKYFSEIKSIFIIILIMFCLITFEERLRNSFNNHIIPLLSVKEFNEAKIIFILLLFTILLFCIYFIYRVIRNRYYVSLWKIVFLSLVVFIYIRYRDFGLGWGYYIAIPSIGTIGFSDILMIYLLVFVIIFWRIYLAKQPEIKTENKMYLPDIPIKCSDDDLLDYKKSTNDLAKLLEESRNQTSSFSIGLTASWGEGKTSYMLLLQEILSKKESEFIIFTFNPRHSLSIHNIQEDFFNILSSKLKQYNSSIKSDFTDYLKAINIHVDSKVLSSFLNIQKIWDKESEKEKINKAIEKTGKKIVVFIDDFDRLLVEEIIEIFKLIDGNASFSNMIFITAYDKKIVNELVMEKYKNTDAFFSDKFFTMEIQLPFRPYRIVYNYLLQKLHSMLNLSNENIILNKSVLDRHFNLLEQYLRTLRDVKRFLNLFILQYKQVEQEILFEDYFLLYLIKYKYLTEYLALRNRDFIKLNTLGEGDENQYFILGELPEKTKSKKILEMLFSKSAAKGFRSINNIAAFEIYFIERLYHNLSISKLEDMFRDSIEDAKAFIDDIVKKVKEFNDIIEYLESKNILKFYSREYFERYIDLLIYIDCKKYDAIVSPIKINELLYMSNQSDISAKYEYQNDDYKCMISNKLQGSYPDYPYSLNTGIIIGLIDNNSTKEMILNKEEALKITKNALDNLLSNEQIVNQKHMNLLCSCISDKNQSGKIILDKSSCTIIKEKIIDNPEGYFQNFVRLGNLTTNRIDYDFVTCEPYWNQIFDGANEIDNIIEKSGSNISNLCLIKNFWNLYKNNDYQPIEFFNQGNVKEKIDNNLEAEINKLNIILDIEGRFIELEKERRKSPRKKDDFVYLKKYKAFLNNIHNIELKITKIKVVQKEIEEVVKLLEST